MTTPNPASQPLTRRARVDAAKSRLLKGTVTRKKADLDLVNERGREVLSFLKQNAKRDLLSVEVAVFEKFKVEDWVDETLEKVEKRE